MLFRRVLFPIPPQDNSHFCSTPPRQSNSLLPHHLTEITVQEKAASCHSPDHQHNSRLLLELWLAQLCPCIPALLSLRSPWHHPSHPSLVLDEGAPSRSKGNSPEGKSVAFSSHHRCSIVFPAKMLLVINSVLWGVSATQPFLLSTGCLISLLSARSSVC